MNERDFLINLALGSYNSQYGQTFDSAYFDVFSIQPQVGYNVAYEIYSVRQDDFLRLRVYFAFTNSDGLENYRLEVDNSNYDNELGNEIFVAYGTIDSYYKENGIYKFGWLGQDETRWGAILLEDDTSILLENGEVLLLEGEN